MFKYIFLILSAVLFIQCGNTSKKIKRNEAEIDSLKTALK